MSPWIKRTALGAVAVFVVLPALVFAVSADAREEVQSLRACARLSTPPIRRIADQRKDRFLGKVRDYTALCRGEIGRAHV